MNKKTKKLLKENNEFAKNITKDSIEALTDIILYLRSCDISIYHQEEVKGDLLHMVAYGEKRNESVRDIIGEDYKIFCDEIVKSFPPRSKKEKVLERLSIFFKILNSLSIIWLLYSLILAYAGEFSIYRMPLTLLLIINGTFVSAFHIFIDNFINKTAFNKSKKEEKSKIFYILLLYFFSTSIIRMYFSKTVLFNLPYYIGLIIIIITFILSKILENLE